MSLAKVAQDINIVLKIVPMKLGGLEIGRDGENKILIGIKKL